MKALMVVGFGTTSPQARKRALDPLAAAAAAAFPDRAPYFALTSERVAATLRARGEAADTLSEAFARLARDGADDVLVVTTCLMEGAESAKVDRAARAWATEDPTRSVRVARPLLADAQGREDLAAALAREFAWMSRDEALLLAGHGSAAGGNDVYPQFQAALRACGLSQAFVATLEGTPPLDDVLPLLTGFRRVRLAPLLMVAGAHAERDLAGAPDSWEGRLRHAGLEVSLSLQGLGEYASVRDLLVARAAAAPKIPQLAD